MGEQTLRGTISKMDMAFCYVTTKKGDVYVPSAALRAHYNAELLNFFDNFRQNEEVEMTVQKQPTQKNGCLWVAKTIKKSKLAPELSEEVHGPMLCSVITTTESYCFATSTMGNIFIPGDAFDANHVKRVNAYAQISDQLIVKFKEQLERSGCKWVAIEAVKNFELNEKEMEQVKETEAKYITGFGTVLHVDNMEVEIFDERNCIAVCGSLLTYTGGFLRNPLAVYLTDVINNGDAVMFKAVPGMALDQPWKAVNWKTIVNTDELVIPKKVNTAESHTQCATDIVYKSFRNLLAIHETELDKIQPIIGKFPDSALPDTYLRARDTQKRLDREAEERKIRLARDAEEQRQKEEEALRKRFSGRK